MSSNKKNRKIFLLIGFPAFLLILVIFAPSYLIYSDMPSKSDAIIVLLGNDFDEKKKEAEQLIHDGISKYLIIPARAEVFKSINKADLTSVKMSVRYHTKSATCGKKYERRYLESTHLEMFHAKNMMDRLGFKSAIFVSSSYHMRRVRLIASKVFGKRDYLLIFVPTRYEKIDRFPWLCFEYDFKMVSSEYVKIAWFFLYSSLM